MTKPDILLLNAAIHTSKNPTLPHQIAAWNLLQGKLSRDALLEFQTLYRNSIVGGEEGDDTIRSELQSGVDVNIKMVDAAFYHDGLAHQEEAWLRLQEVLSEEVLLEFQGAFRRGPMPISQPIVSTTARYMGRAIKLPTGVVVYTDQPIIPGGAFSWGEATHGGERVPQSSAHVRNIIDLATQLQRARQQIGRPFRVTSWYRPEPWNSRAGGVRNSQHLAGRGVDVVVQGYDGGSLGRALDWWPGGRGIYPGNRRHILHLDIGPKRQWGF